MITGAAGGFGCACTKVFVREGAKVLAVDISGAEEQLAAEFGAAVTPRQERLAILSAWEKFPIFTGFFFVDWASPDVLG